MNNSKKILITGSNGYLGRALYKDLDDLGHELLGSVQTTNKFVSGQNNISVGPLDKETNWENALSDCNTIIHLASRTHILKETYNNPADEFRRVNTEGIENLAVQAVRFGVKKFIFISSIGVYGSSTGSSPVSIHSDFNPISPYAQSKLDSELILRDVAKGSSMEIVIIRPPAIYGKGAPGNLGLIESLVKKDLFLPFGSLNNSRHMIYLHNLTSFISFCVNNNVVNGKDLLIDDGYALSTKQVATIIANLSSKRIRLLNIPPAILKLFLYCIGKSNFEESLIKDYLIDSSYTNELTGWLPPFSPSSFL